jgi:HEPN domain-containing protein
MSNVEHAKKFLKIAGNDLEAFKILASAEGFESSITGFHAQQAIEKYLKAILFFHRIPFRKTHNLNDLMQLVKTVVKDIPFNTNDLEVLNPYAVLLRYDEIVESEFDIPKAQELIESIKVWATKIVGD